ncbi:DUF1819 family protein [Pseudalkalibacillus decolorationis]|uniref:DUF1819 family protein n=1 Tax=Pseudalkalibacillus decolorationis TaxID=163879 RepID=UPI002147FA9F|nr:DUF1819 family protein [Pseudalkalibacillus decolorationis]
MSEGRILHMSKELLYSTSLSGAAFLFSELKQVISLDLEGLSKKEIRERVMAENLFQYKVPGSAKRSLPSVLRRLDVLDEELKKMVIEEPIDLGKLINLYAILKTDRLFFEFMREVISEKLKNDTYLLEKIDINGYFTYKAEQDERVAGWSEQTVNKLKQVFLKILCEVGILQDSNSGELSRLLIDEHIRSYLLSIGEHEIVHAMGE